MQNCLEYGTLINYRIRIHRAWEDNGHGEAERTNSAVGDADIDGGSIKREYFYRFYDKSDEEIEKMTMVQGPRSNFEIGGHH